MLETSFFHNRLLRPLAPRNLFWGLVLWFGALSAICVLVLWLESRVLHSSDVDWHGVVMLTFMAGGPFLALNLLVSAHLLRMEGKMAQLAATDVLTGLRNRRAFISEAGRLHDKGTPGLVLILDADHFKRINDEFGHAVGDDCLRALAAQINQVTRETDVVGRIGGEEFGIYMPGATKREAQGLGLRLCEGVEFTCTAGRPLKITSSIGGTSTRHGEALDAAMIRADRALYAAKVGGRARMVLRDSPGPQCPLKPGDIRSGQSAVGHSSQPASDCATSSRVAENHQ